ncbi:MAG TPA: hypothetical protein VJ773_03725 [Gemmatimonadales bacterium]|nr:hypothetical protein [Gemmatimonadales bacterium]
MINDLLKARLLRKLESLDDERAYQVLDYVEFLESRYGRRAEAGGLFDRLTETVEDVMRAGRLPVKAVSGTMSVVDTAAKLMKGVAAAGQAAVEEAVKAVGPTERRSDGAAGTTGGTDRPNLPDPGPPR